MPDFVRRRITRRPRGLKTGPGCELFRRRKLDEIERKMSLTAKTKFYKQAAVIVLMVLLGISPAAALRPPDAERLPLERPGVREALEQIERDRDRTAAFLAEIGGIISPSGQELDRAHAVAARMREIGLQKVRVDEAPNAIGEVPGRSERALVFVSTLDDLATVAEHQRRRAAPPRIAGDRVEGPGTNTSSTTAAMLAAAEALIANGVQPEHDLVFASVAQEETGLTGMKRLYEQYRGRAAGFVDILGDGSRISCGSIGIHWWKVIARGPAGHSLGGGLPNVNQGIARAVDRILLLPHPQRHSEMRTVVNIAQIHSGVVYNHKPEEGWFSLDLRSLENRVIADMEAQVRTILDRVGDETGITFEMEPFQLTPGGQLAGARESALVRTAEAGARWLGLDPRLSKAGSSNMNVAVAGGTLAIGLGGSRGGSRGQPEEWADIPAMLRSARLVLLLAASSLAPSQ
ncbi:MAG: M20/M25/M40 family metallo-hydrolase [Candidatus Aminicenantes bacterium]